MLERLNWFHLTGLITLFIIIIIIIIIFIIVIIYLFIYSWRKYNT